MVASAPPAAPLGRALRESTVLASLLDRLAQSEAFWTVASSRLPASLAAAVRPGPLDEKGWVLLVDNAAAAAKLRQCLPDLESAVAADGGLVGRIRIKVSPRG